MIYLFIIALVLLCYLVLRYIDSRYETFVFSHSTAVKKLQEINEKYNFKEVPSFDMECSYDNKIYFASISPEDYLTYQLVYKRKEVLQGIKDTAENKKMYAVYNDLIKSTCIFNHFDTEKLPMFKGWLIRIEERVFKSMKHYPVTQFCIRVRLWETNIGGARYSSKEDEFYAEKIEEIINRLSHKNGDFYLDERIWDSICRVERGRVTNKMRFAIYARDNYRCRKCGRATQDLEIDHIFPISKGGKSNFDNLQTLCHRCNALKSDNVEYGAVNPRAKAQNTYIVCPECGAPLVKKRGKYGEFYACPNYPKCKYTKRI